MRCRLCDNWRYVSAARLVNRALLRVVLLDPLQDAHPGRGRDPVTRLEERVGAHSRVRARISPLLMEQLAGTGP